MQQVGSYDQWVGRDAHDSDGERVGEIRDIFYDDVSGRPEWVSVTAGIFTGTRLVPIAGAQLVDHPDDDDDDGGRLVLAYESERIKDAPDFDALGGHLDADQERTLYSHYGFDWSGRTNEDFGYGKAWEQHRFDKDYSRREMGAIGEVPVRLRRYNELDRP